MKLYRALSINYVDESTSTLFMLMFVISCHICISIYKHSFLFKHNYTSYCKYAQGAIVKCVTSPKYICSSLMTREI